MLQIENVHRPIKEKHKLLNVVMISLFILQAGVDGLAGVLVVQPPVDQDISSVPVSAPPPPYQQPALAAVKRHVFVLDYLHARELVSGFVCLHLQNDVHLCSSFVRKFVKAIFYLLLWSVIIESIALVHNYIYV